MNFSPSFPLSNALCFWSPNGRYLAYSSQCRLLIRDSENLNVIGSHVVLESIDLIVWSPDSSLLSASISKAGLTYIFSPHDSEWSGKISEGQLEVVDVVFSPNSRFLLTVVEFNLRVSFWSLSTPQKTFVPYVKYPKGSGTLSFSPDGKVFSVVVRKNGKDYVSFHEIENEWRHICGFEIQTKDCVGSSWSPNSQEIVAVWDSPLVYSLFILRMDGRILCHYSAYNHALGIQTVVWDPNGKYIALGSYDQKIRLLNCFTWTLLIEFETQSTLRDPLIEIYEEKEKTYKDIDVQVALELSGNQNSVATTFVGVTNRPVELSYVSPDSKKLNFKFGISEIKISHSGIYLACRNDSMSAVLWIWNIQKITLQTVIVLKNPGISNFEWEPKCPRLLICGNNSSLYVWTPVGTVVAQLPNSEELRNIVRVSWNPCGNVFTALTNDKFICCKLGKVKN